MSRKSMMWLIIIALLTILTCLYLINNHQEQILKPMEEENTLAIYLEGEPIHYISEKDSGYTLDLMKSSCTNQVTLDFDYDTWTIKTNYSNYIYENNESKV